MAPFFTSKKSFSLLVFVALLSAVLGQEYKPIDTLQVDAYLGRWYQMYANLYFVLLEFGGRCSTADYELAEPKKIALINQSRPHLIPRFLARTTGFAVQGNEAEGAFTVNQRYLFSTDPDEVTYNSPGNYWIVGIGPIVDDQYQWAVVSNPRKTLSFVIARDPVNFPGSQYEEDALQLMADFGFTDLFLNAPIATHHFWCGNYN